MLINANANAKYLRCKLGTLFYTARPIFGIAFELV